MIKWHSPSGAEKELARRGELRCWLALSGAPGSERVPAVVRIDEADSTVSVELWSDAPGWPTTMGGWGSGTYYGWTTGDEHKFTLIDPYVSRGRARSPRGYEPRALRGGHLVLGAHVDAKSTFSVARYRTGRLHEWIGKSNLCRSVEFDDGITAVEHRWEKPPPLRISRPDAHLVLIGVLEEETPGPWSPEGAMRSDTEVVVRLRTSQSHEELFSGFALPLLAFTSLASSQPDWLLLDVAAGDGRSGRFIHREQPDRDWRWSSDRGRFLFRAKDVDDPAALLARWFALWPDIELAATTFGEALRSGPAYSRSRVVEVVAALEALWKVRSENLPRQRPGLKGMKAKLGQLADYCEVDRETLAATEDELSDLVDARNLYAHLNNLSAEERHRLDHMMVENARRGQLLFQACMLRELEIPPSTAARWIQRHLENWPIS